MSLEFANCFNATISFNIKLARSKLSAESSIVNAAHLSMIYVLTFASDLSKASHLVKEIIFINELNSRLEIDFNDL